VDDSRQSPTPRFSGRAVKTLALIVTAGSAQLPMRNQVKYWGQTVFSAFESMRNIELLEI